jgi:hypothetical protein
MDAKLQILKDTFENSFSVDRFLRFSKEFFCNIKVINPDRDITSIQLEYKYTVESYRHMAAYEVDGNVLDILAVKLKFGRSVERARSMQRSFISKLLSVSSHDGAVVAFYTGIDPFWRLSFIRLDYEFAAGRAKMSLTPAKRYSYLVGEKEPCHTAMEQLYPIFRDENYRPTFDKIEEAFSVERVTKEFFEKYKEKYFILKEHLDSNTVFCEEAERHGFTSEQFAKKMMGQLAFLYFLQKKGWLGVKVLPHTLSEKEYKNAFFKSKASREIIPQIYKQTGTEDYILIASKLTTLSDSDADIAASCFRSDEWGSGTRTFVRDLFANCKSKNFYDEYLEPLFYEALNQRRGRTHYYKRFNCKIPFLNGGLFEPIEHYDWEHCKFEIPNDLFSNITTKGDREADGILDIFDHYNFTMNEDEPLEREVAVDPEMLGKIFENLLDIKDRKTKGAFYTPRKIVHYMCAESLANYLVGKTGVAYDDINLFIIDGEFMKDEDYNKRGGTRRLPESVFANLRVIDEALKSIKVADPAVGSGAFPLGMLSEIVKARNNISYYYASQLPKADERARLFEQREPYRLKWETIQNCIFAVDVEASAVDIAKLRLWLSLVVDEDLSPTFDDQRLGDARQKDPRPLPNLDFNIMCGNSLADEFEGIQLFDGKMFGNTEPNNQGGQASIQLGLFMDSMTILLDDLRKEQERLFGEQNADMKQEIKHKIDKIIDEIIRTKLSKDNNTDGLRKYEESQKQKTKPYFLWKLEFARVFRENGGFDVVIGNPPYIQLQSMSAEAKKFQKSYQSFSSMGDIYCLFYELGCNLLANNRILAFITSNKWMRAGYGEKMRKYFSDNTNPLRLIDFAGHKVFDSATVDVNIMILEKLKNKGQTHACIIKDDCSTNLSVYIERNSTATYFDTGDSWTILSPIEQSIKRKIEAVGVPLKDWDIQINYGIKTGFNEAFIIDGEKREELIATDTKSAEIIRPILRGRDIKRYSYNFADLWVILAKFGSHAYLENDYPAVFAHLKQHEDKLKQRGQCRYNASGKVNVNKPYPGQHHWLELDNNPSDKYLEDFSKQKITWGNLCLKAQYALVENAYFISAPASMIVPGDKYLLAVLNSNVADFYIRNLGVTRNGGYFEYKPMFIERLPIPQIADDKKITFTKLIDNILRFRKNNFDTCIIEHELNNIIYDVYKLSDDEKYFIDLK